MENEELEIEMLLNEIGEAIGRRKLFFYDEVVSKDTFMSEIKSLLSEGSIAVIENLLSENEIEIEDVTYRALRRQILH